MVKFTPRTLDDLDRTPVPFAQQAGWVQEPIWTSWRRANSLFPKGILMSSLNYNTTVLRVATVFWNASRLQIPNYPLRQDAGFSGHRLLNFYGFAYFSQQVGASSSCTSGKTKTYKSNTQFIGFDQVESSSRDRKTNSSAISSAK